METGRTKVTSKGQVTIPKNIRDRLGLDVGDEIEFFEEDGKLKVRKILAPSIRRWRGYLKELDGQDPDDLVREMRGD